MPPIFLDSDSDSSDDGFLSVDELPTPAAEHEDMKPLLPPMEDSSSDVEAPEDAPMSDFEAPSEDESANAEVPTAVEKTAIGGTVVEEGAVEGLRMSRTPLDDRCEAARDNETAPAAGTSEPDAPSTPAVRQASRPAAEPVCAVSQAASPARESTPRQLSTPQCPTPPETRRTAESTRSHTVSPPSMSVAAGKRRRTTQRDLQPRDSARTARRMCIDVPPTMNLDLQTIRAALAQSKQNIGRLENLLQKERERYDAWGEEKDEWYAAQLDVKPPAPLEQDSDARLCAPQKKPRKNAKKASVSSPAKKRFKKEPGEEEECLMQVYNNTNANVNNTLHYPVPPGTEPALAAFINTYSPSPTAPSEALLRVFATEPPLDLPNTPFKRPTITRTLGGNTQSTWPVPATSNHSVPHPVGHYICIRRDLNPFLPLEPGNSGALHVFRNDKAVFGQTYPLFVRDRKTADWTYFGQYKVIGYYNYTHQEWMRNEKKFRQEWVTHVKDAMWGKKACRERGLEDPEGLAERLGRRDGEEGALRLCVRYIQFVGYDTAILNALTEAVGREEAERRRGGGRAEVEEAEWEDYEGRYHALDL